MTYRRRGSLFVVSAPSGAGKSTLLKVILPRLSGVTLSISCTTRPPRPGEANGRDYFFLNEEQFLEKIEHGDFLEWARVHRHLYGTDGRHVERLRNEGRDVILEIDVQGARQVRLLQPDAWTIFVLPPSWKELEHRLRSRGTEDEEQLHVRLEAARREAQEAAWYDFFIINDDLEKAAEDLQSVIRACRCRTEIQGPFLHEVLYRFMGPLP